ncbi:MAG: M20 family metallopeptidase [Dehalococcoidia bacterium]
MADVEAVKRRLCEVVDGERATLLELSHRIHQNPEVAFQEFKASAWLADYLASRGFAVTRGAFEISTAFMARKGSGAPVVAFMAEFDALPGIGHGCGHNVIGTAGCGAGVALASVLKQTGGTVIVFGTPAEEGGGAKVTMMRRGCLDGVDVAMMVHPSGGREVDGGPVIARATFEVEFFGKAAHAASSPELGINALDALVIGYMGAAALRQHIPATSKIHGIITDGGQAPNIVPEHAAGRFYVRARTETELEALKERVLSCFRAGATATGARVEFRWINEQVSELWTNETLAGCYRENAARIGRTVANGRELPPGSTGSTDMGNVSKAVPAIHPMISISATRIPGHSIEMTAAAASELGDEAVTDGAKALAMTGADVLLRPEILESARRDFAATKAKAG